MTRFIVPSDAAGLNYKGITMSKVALLHYWLTNMRGGENVLAEFCALYPRADIYTHAWNPAVAAMPFGGHRVVESFIGRLPGARRGCQKYLPLMPMALRRWDLHDYDLILSSESGPVKGVEKAPGAVHVCYCHTPMRYLWDMYADYYARAGWGGKLGMKLFTKYLRRYDLASADKVDYFIANSRFVADRIWRLYGRESAVIHPPVDTEAFSPAAAPKGDYYLFVGQLTGYKRPDLAVAACLRLNRKLVLVGDGEAAGELKRMAAGNKNIVFEGRADRWRLRSLYAGARALLFPGVEDFGIVPLEAQASGTPVVAFEAGGALETVKSEETGVFFSKPTADSLAAALELCEGTSWKTETLVMQAARFGRERFRREIAAFIQQAAGR